MPYRNLDRMDPAEHEGDPPARQGPARALRRLTASWAKMPAPMTTAASVPSTHGELEGDEALETLRATGRRRLVADAISRFRAADGFSHSRALAFQVCLTLLPAIIAVVGLAAALDQETFARVVRETIAELAPGRGGRHPHRGAAAGHPQRAAGDAARPRSSRASSPR